MFDAPPWLDDAINFYSDALRLHDWSITYSLKLCVNGGDNILGSCAFAPTINHSHIDLRADIADTEQWHTALIHELLHTKLARLDDYVSDVMVSQLASPVQELAKRTLVDCFLEPYVDSLADALTPFLYPAWHEHYHGDADDEEEDDSHVDDARTNNATSNQTVSTA